MINLTLFSPTREDRQIYLNLQENCREMRDEIARMESQCSVQMEKRFGEGITFKDIEAFAVNRTLEEMKEVAKRSVEAKYRKLEKKNVRLVTQFDRQIY